MTASVSNQNTVLKVVLAVLLPPLAVFMDSGLGGQFLLNVLLTIIGLWVVGVIHALIVVL